MDSLEFLYRLREAQRQEGNRHVDVKIEHVSTKEISVRYCPTTRLRGEPELGVPGIIITVPAKNQP